MSVIVMNYGGKIVNKKIPTPSTSCGHLNLTAPLIYHALHISGLYQKKMVSQI